MREDPLYPFGFGLSFTTFRYLNLRLSSASVEAGSSVTVTVDVANEGNRDGHEVAQLYLSSPFQPGPARQLAGFQRVWVPSGSTRTVSFALAPRQLSTVGEDGARAVQPGRYRLSVGGRQPDARSAALAGNAVLEAVLDITGSSIPLPP